MQVPLKTSEYNAKYCLLLGLKAVTLHPVTIRDHECSWVSKERHWSWAPPHVESPWEELCVSNIVGGCFCPGLQAFPGRWRKPTTLPHLRRVSQAQREGLSTCAVDPEPLGSWVWVRVHSGEGQEEQGLCACASGTGGSRRLRFRSLALGVFSSFDYSQIYNICIIIG